MRLTCYALHGDAPKIVPAPADRDWMNDFTGRHAYRCLPLAIANCYGWQILLPAQVKATWDGGDTIPGLTVETPRTHTAVSNFSRGVLTFDVPYIFRTEPGYHLIATGPSNTFKDGATALTAVIETDWLPYTFTMNYQMTRAGTVVWEENEPFCQIFVVPAGFQEAVEPELKNIWQNPELQDELAAWTRERTSFRGRQDRGEPEAIKEAWQRFYFTGKYPDGRTAPSHQSKLRLKPIEDNR